MRRRIIASNKGGAPLDEALPVIVFIAVALAAFFIVTYISYALEKEKKENIYLGELGSDAEYYLSHLLSQPIDRKKLSEHLTEAYLTNDYTTAQEYTKEYLTKYIPKGIIKVKDSSGHTVFSVGPTIDAAPFSIQCMTAFAKSVLPLPDKQKSLIIELLLPDRTKNCQRGRGYA